jgi:dihydropteroate synthase
VIVTPLALDSPSAVRDALCAHGWDPELAGTTGLGVHPLGFHIRGLDAAAIEALVPFAGRLGLEVVTGPDWALLVGSRARLSTLARPWTVPPAASELALRIGLAMPAEPPAVWRTARGAIPLGEPVIAGILNVTPDSFSDGGRHATVDAALAHAERLVADGAAIVDLGGQSSRPGARQIDAAEEIERVVPVVRALAARFPELAISVDTVRAEVARASLSEGAAIVNDVSAFRLDPAMAAVVAGHAAGAILMHSRGGFESLATYEHAEYDDVAAEVAGELRDAVDRALTAGVPEEAIALDPGLGFGKRAEHSLTLLDRLGTLTALGRPILVGPSRKRFLGAATGIEEPAARDGVTAVACALAWERGARLFRVHDVASTRAALSLARATRTSSTTATR